MTAHHHLRRFVTVSLTAFVIVLVVAACSSSGSGHNKSHKVHLSASKAYPNASTLASALHTAKVACGTPTTVSKLPAGVGSEVSCDKTHYGVLDVVVFPGTTVPTAWTASYHHLCGSSAAATDYVRGKNWAIVAASTASGNSGLDRLAHKVNLHTTSFCS